MNKIFKIVGVVIVALILIVGIGYTLASAQYDKDKTGGIGGGGTQDDDDNGTTPTPPPIPPEPSNVIKGYLSYNIHVYEKWIPASGTSGARLADDDSVEYSLRPFAGTTLVKNTITYTAGSAPGLSFLDFMSDSLSMLTFASNVDKLQCKVDVVGPSNFHFTESYVMDSLTTSWKLTGTGSLIQVGDVVGPTPICIIEKGEYTLTFTLDVMSVTGGVLYEESIKAYWSP